MNGAEVRSDTNGLAIEFHKSWRTLAFSTNCAFCSREKLQQEDRAWFLIKLPCGRQELRLIRMVEQILEHGGLEKTFPVQLTE